jgi:hypothetical protein
LQGRRKQRKTGSQPRHLKTALILLVHIQYVCSFVNYLVELLKSGFHMTPTVGEFHCRWLLDMSQILRVSEIIFSFNDYRQWVIWKPGLRTIARQHIAGICEPGFNCFADTRLFIANIVRQIATLIGTFLYSLHDMHQRLKCIVKHGGNLVNVSERNSDSNSSQIAWKQSQFQIMWITHDFRSLSGLLCRNCMFLPYVV